MNDKKLLKMIAQNTAPKANVYEQAGTSQMLTERRRFYPIVNYPALTHTWTVPANEVWEVLTLSAISGFAGLGTDESIVVDVYRDGLAYWEYVDPSGGANGLQLRMAKGWPARTVYLTGGINYACAPSIPFYLVEGDALTVAGAGLGAGDSLQVGAIFNVYSSEEVRT